MSMPGHDHRACMSAALKKAEALCAERGARLTPIRKRVLELVWSGHKAVKAYDILEKLDSGDGALAPPTVYRALEFLQDQGLVHKIESLNAFVGCAHPADGHDCSFFICDRCGEVSECCDEQISRRIGKRAEEEGFIPARRMLEIHGACARCGRA